ncbi:MLXPL protein, partial [Centropus bengalensis]|nr:MLXPL protein [Centropus bengalensis]
PLPAYVGNADMIQPDLAPLQPSLDDMEISDILTAHRLPAPPAQLGYQEPPCFMPMAEPLFGSGGALLGARGLPASPEAPLPPSALLQVSGTLARPPWLPAPQHPLTLLCLPQPSGASQLGLHSAFLAPEPPLAPLPPEPPAVAPEQKHLFPGLLHASRGRQGCSWSWGSLGQGRWPEPPGLPTAASSCPLAAKPEPVLDAPHLVRGGLMPMSPSSSVSLHPTPPVGNNLTIWFGAALTAREVTSPAGAGVGLPSGRWGEEALWVTPCDRGLDSRGWGASSHLSIFFHKRNRAEVGNAHLAGPLSWRPCPVVMTVGCPMGIGLPVPSLVPSQSALPDVPAAFLSGMAQLSPALAAGSSPSQVVPGPVALLGTQPGPLPVPKAERLSPASACGTDWPKPSQASPGPSVGLSTGVSLPAVSRRGRPESSKVESRRITHISAEQKRRFNIKLGFDTLHSLVSTLSAQPSIKVSKATTLQKTAEYICKLQQERAALQDEAQRLREQIEELNSSINLCQEQLPATGVPITRQRFDQMRSMFNEYVRSSTLQNWKFWIFSIIIRPLFESFNGMVSTASLESLTQTSLAWLDQHCSLPALRPS